MNRDKIGWGIIGAGIIAGKMADALGCNTESILSAVASKTPARAQAFAEKYGIPKSYTYDEIVNDDEIDVIYIATTHNYHYENARLALEHGKHVLVEKAFTVNSWEAYELTKLAEERNLFIMEAIWVRFLPSIKLLKEIIQKGTIGEIRQIVASFGNIVLPMYERRLKDPGLAGGVTLDMGIYPISFVCYMLDEIPSEIKSMTRFSDSGVDETSNYGFRFPSGCFAQICTSFNLWMKNEAVIYGTEGFIEFPDFQHGDNFNIKIHDGTGKIINSEEIICNNHENGFIYQVEEVIRCVREGLVESGIICHRETVAIMKVMDDMRHQWGFKYPFE